MPETAVDPVKVRALELAMQHVSAVEVVRHFEAYLRERAAPEPAPVPRPLVPAGRFVCPPCGQVLEEQDGRSRLLCSGCQLAWSRSEGTEFYDDAAADRHYVRADTPRNSRLRVYRPVLINS